LHTLSIDSPIDPDIELLAIYHITNHGFNINITNTYILHMFNTTHLTRGKQTQAARLAVCSRHRFAF